MKFPAIGALSVVDRLRGWRDLRCVFCGEITGAGNPGGALTACASCTQSNTSMLITEMGVLK